MPATNTPGAMPATSETKLEAAFTRCATPPTRAGMLLLPADWLALGALLQRDSLLTYDEVQRVGERLHQYPVSLERLLLEFAREVPEATAYDACFSAAAVRVRSLGPLLVRWELQHMSRAQTRMLLLLLEELDLRLRKSSGSLAGWHEAFRSDGSETAHSLFWDSLDPAAAAPYSAHAFQREMAAELEKRRSKRRVLAVRPTRAAPRVEPSGIERHVCTSSEGAVRLEVLVAPHAGVPFDALQALLARIEAHRQLALSPHIADVLGHEPVAPPETCARPSARWFVELVEAPPLRRLRDASGPVGEGSALHRHWRRSIVEAMLHVSAQTTFLLRAPVSLANVRAADGGERLVLTGLEFDAEFPEALPGDASDFDHQLERDAYLVRDAIGMLTELLPSTADEAAAAVAALGAAGGDDLHTLPQIKLEKLRAICSVVAGARLPTLRHLLSHPYFAPLSVAERLEVEPQYERWRVAGGHRAGAAD